MMYKIVYKILSSYSVTTLCGVCLYIVQKQRSFFLITVHIGLKVYVRVTCIIFFVTDFHWRTFVYC
jgi:hypothetical protein